MARGPHSILQRSPTNNKLPSRSSQGLTSYPAIQSSVFSLSSLPSLYNCGHRQTRWHFSSRRRCPQGIVDFKIINSSFLGLLCGLWISSNQCTRCYNSRLKVIACIFRLEMRKPANPECVVTPWPCRFAFHSSCEITHLAPILSFLEVYWNAGLTDQIYTWVVTLGLYHLLTSPFSTFFILDFSNTISLHLSGGWAPNHLDGLLASRCALLKMLWGPYDFSAGSRS